MKRFLLLSLMVAVVSCGVDKKKLLSYDPAIYETEIVDLVKYLLTVVQYDSDLLMENQWDEQYELLRDLIDNRYISQQETTYRDVLEYYASRPGEMHHHAKALLAKYDALRISLSDYVQTADRDDYKSWVFTEQRTGVKFLFEIDKRDDTTPDGYGVWRIEPDEESLFNYMDRL